MQSILEGVEPLMRRINQLELLGLTGKVEEALRPGAELMKDRWKQNVPRPGPDHPYSEGQYYESIRVEHDEDGFAVLTDAMNEMDGTPYPELLEYGTSTMAAQPSALPAFDDSVDEAIDMAIGVLDEMILEAIAR